MRRVITCCLLTSWCLVTDGVDAGDWPQFRGPNAAGTAAESGAIPTQLGPNENLLWRTPLTRGISSPCVRGGWIFLTEFDAEAALFFVVAVDQTDGRIDWRKPVAAEEIEKVHKVSSPANATVAADDERIYVYFASCGLFCFDHDGEQLWEYPLPVSQRINGSGTSPIVVGDRVLLNREDNKEKYLLALDAKTGEEVWKQTHGSLMSLFGGGGPVMGEATPIVWNDQFILHRQNEVAGFSLDDGERQWAHGLRTTAASTPIIDDDVLYVAAWNNFGEAELQGELPEFAALVEEHDKDGDGMLSREELPWGPAFSQRPELAGRNLGGDISVKLLFGMVDADRDGNISEQEWTLASAKSAMLMAGSMHGLTAIQLVQTEGKVEPKQLWQENRSVPECPSPLVVGEHVYMVKNGGKLTCLDKQTGKVAYRQRLQAAGLYCASLVTDGHVIIAASGDGVLTLFEPGETFRKISTSDLGEPIFATPAIVDGVLYVRTDAALYAFAEGT